MVLRNFEHVLGQARVRYSDIVPPVAGFRVPVGGGEEGGGERVRWWKLKRLGINFMTEV